MGQNKETNEAIVPTKDDSAVIAENKKLYVFLATGVDDVSGLTDVMFLISFNMETNKLFVLQIPRDTYFNSSDSTYKKINGAVSALGGMEQFSNEIESVCGIEIDYTFKFTLDSFGKLVDIIGGIPINIPENMDYDDPYQDLHIHLKAGEHILDGESAKQFVRFRSGYVRGDIDRTDAQKIFIAAFVKKVTTDVGIFQISSAIDILLDDVETNMKFSDCLEFASKMLSLNSQNVVMLTMCGSDARTKINSGAWYYIINRAAAIEIFNKYFTPYYICVDESNFDVNRKFTNSQYPHFDEIYYDDKYEIIEYDADNINTKGIKIGRID